MQGEAASINAVANFITQLKRSGYFDNVEIKTATEDDIVPSVQTYGFSMTASVSPQPTAGQTQPAAKPTGTTQQHRSHQRGEELIMATSFKEWPWPLQALFWVGLSVAIILAGFYVPGTPLTNLRTQLQTAQAEMKPLEADVQNLRVYKQRRAEFNRRWMRCRNSSPPFRRLFPKKSRRTNSF